MAIRMSTRLEAACIFAAVFILLLLPAVIRWDFLGINSIIGFPTFMHQRISQEIADGTFNWYDELSFSGRPYTYPPAFPFMLAPFQALLGIDWGGVAMMALLGSATAVLFYFFARQYAPARWSLLVLAASPLFIFLFTHLSTRSPPITLSLIALYAFSRKKHWIIAGLSMGTAFLFSPEGGIMAIIVLGVYAMQSKQKESLIKAAAAAVAIALLWYAPFLMQHGLPEYNLLHKDYTERGYEMGSLLIPNFFWETGYEGFAIAAYALLVIGLLFVKDRFMRAWLLLALIASLALWRLFLYMIFPVSIIAAAGLGKVMARDGWRKMLGALAVAYIIIAGSLFIYEFASGYPIAKQVKAFEWIRDNTAKDAVILSDWTHGHWIAGIAMRKNFMDGYAEYAPNASARLEAMYRFFSDCTVPQGYGITHIYAEKWMIDQRSTQCIFGKFRMVYNESEIFVFEV